MIYVIIALLKCIQRFELVSQVSYVANGPLVSPLQWQNLHYWKINNENVFSGVFFIWNALNMVQQSLFTQLLNELIYLYRYIVTHFSCIPKEMLK